MSAMANRLVKYCFQTNENNNMRSTVLLALVVSLLKHTKLNCQHVYVNTCKGYLYDLQLFTEQVINDYIEAHRYKTASLCKIRGESCNMVGSLLAQNYKTFVWYHIAISLNGFCTLRMVMLFSGPLSAPNVDDGTASNSHACYHFLVAQQSSSGTNARQNKMLHKRARKSDSKYQLCFRYSC